ncbi:unnamed protein product [Phytomonas sp. Hart1]|nr:unnamed protein product [Phytomonas sp. Hart1]|eukprot:CCW67679.1 unnamed protein product [Phytomonas sp. isolate Hart1]
MTILHTPFISLIHDQWNTIASGLNHFCVQENADKKASKDPNPTQQCMFSDKDMMQFRIIYINGSLDLSNHNGKIDQLPNKYNKIAAIPEKDTNGAVLGFVPAVVAVADNVEDILNDWALILRAGLLAERRTNAVPFDGKGNGDHQARRLEWFVEKLWKPLYADVQEQLFHKNAKVAHRGIEKKYLHPGKLAKGPLPPLTNTFVLPKLGMGTDMVVSTVTSGEVSHKANLSKLPMNDLMSEGIRCSDTVPNEIDKAYSPFYDVYDVVILRLWDLWSWRDPQRTALVLLVLMLGGALYRGIYLFNSVATGLLLFVLPIPLTCEQRCRLREVPKAISEESSYASLSSECTLTPGDQKAMDEAQSWVKACIASDANRMRLLDKFLSTPRISPSQGTQKTKLDSSSSLKVAQGGVKLPYLQEINQRIGLPPQNIVPIQKLLHSYLGKICMVYVLVQLIITITFPYYSICLTLDMLIVPVVGVSMLITGLGQLHSVFITTLKKVYKQAQINVHRPSLMKVEKRIVSQESSSVGASCANKASDSTSTPLRTIAKFSPLGTPPEKEYSSKKKKPDHLRRLASEVETKHMYTHCPP